MGRSPQGDGRVAQFTVRKLDHTGRQVIAYPGTVLRQDDTILVLRTAWIGDARDLGFVVLDPSDCWTEYFFPGRRYNAFEIRASDGRLKGWYCNITRLPQIGPSDVRAEDLALDVWVTPERQTLVLDEDEFRALPLQADERAAARAALKELLGLVRDGGFPFDRCPECSEWNRGCQPPAGDGEA